MDMTLCDYKGCIDQATMRLQVIDHPDWQGHVIDACDMPHLQAEWRRINRPTYLKALEAEINE